MTFRGNLLQYSLWYELHPFENLRRKGNHCHGLTHLSWAERKIFYRVLGKKFCGLFIYPGQSVRQVGCLCPRRQGLIRVCGTRQAMSRDPLQRREARFAKRRCSLHPGVFLPGCQERRPRRDKGGATVPVAASRGFCVRDGSPPGRRQLRWLHSRQPAPPGGRPGKP